jgi:hypothetical protein
LSEELKELKKISKLLILANGEAIEKELSKYATTPERKKAWILIDGNRMTDEIGKGAGMKLRTIQDFLKILTDSSLIESHYGKPPIKIIDYVPAPWLDLIQWENANQKEKVEGKTDEPKERPTE